MGAPCGAQQGLRKYEVLGFDDIAGFEKMMILRFLIFGLVFLDLSLSSCLRHILISIYVVFSF